jgi:hypothetical protein
MILKIVTPGSSSSPQTCRRRFIQMPAPLKAWLKTYPLEETVLPAAWHKEEKAVWRLARWKVGSNLVESQVPSKTLPEWLTTPFATRVPPSR